jgi:hypothetical protein
VDDFLGCEAEDYKLCFPGDSMESFYVFLQRYDQDADGKLDFADFCKLIDNHRVRKELATAKEEQEAQSNWKKNYAFAKTTKRRSKRPK